MKGKLLFGCLSLKACALCILTVCGCVCVSGHAYIKTSSPLNNWQSHLKPSSSLILSHKASEPSILESPGPEEPGKQSSAGGERKDLCCPSLLYWDEVCDLHPEAGWMEGKGSQEVVLEAGKS